MARFAASAWSRASGQRLFGKHAVGHVAADALHFAAAVGAHGDFAPGDPARAVGRGDFLVVHLRAVGETTGFALLRNRQRKRGRQKVLARAAGKRAERVVGVGDRAVAVAAHDDVALRLEEARGALLRFAYFPVAIRRVVEPRLEIAQLGLHLADAGNQDSDGSARGAEQRRDADGEHVGIVVGLGGSRPGEEAEGDRKSHRGNRHPADNEGKEAAAEDGGLSERGVRPHGPCPALCAVTAAVVARAGTHCYRCSDANFGL